MSFIFQVGSFNYAIDKLIFRDEFTPTKEKAVRSILDYDIDLHSLTEEQMQVILNSYFTSKKFSIISFRI